MLPSTALDVSVVDVEISSVDEFNGGVSEPGVMFNGNCSSSCELYTCNYISGVARGGVGGGVGGFHPCPRPPQLW